MRHTPLLALTAIAAAAVTATRFVGHNGQHAAAAADALGVADYDAAIGDAFAVTVIGTARVTAGGAFAKGALLEVGATGKAVARAAGKQVAKALEASAGDGAFVTVLLTP